jgi:hypothetical protein
VKILHVVWIWTREQYYLVLHIAKRCGSDPLQNYFRNWHDLFVTLNMFASSLIRRTFTFREMEYSIPWPHNIR